jgi:hypothetical protein
MLTDIHIARYRGGGRPARHSCTTRCRRVAEAVFALDSAFAFVRVEHVERVVARGLLDDEHETLGRALDRHAVMVWFMPLSFSLYTLHSTSTPLVA